MQAALFLAVSYNTITNMAGLYIVSDLGGSPHISVYPMVFFGLGNLAAIPLADPLASRFGAIKLLVYSLLLYTVFSHFCAIAPTYFLLNLYRVGLGFGAGFFLILCRRLMLAFAPEEKMKNYTFVMLMIFAVAPVVGASVGAWLAYESHWRWIFYFNEPVALALAAYFWFFHRKLDGEPSVLTVDWVSYVAFGLGVGCLLTAATLGQQLDWYRSNVFLALIAVGAPSLLLFWLRSSLSATPLVELNLLKTPLFFFSLLSTGVLFSSYFGMIILVSLWLNIYVHYTPLWIALLLGIMGSAAVIAFFLSRTFLHRLDSRIALGVAIVCLAISCYYSTYFDQEVDFFHLAVARTLAGVGLVLFLFPVVDLCFKSVLTEKGPSAYILFQVTRCLFSSLGAGLYVILWQRRQVFFHERLGEKITLTSQLASHYFHRAEHVFHLTPEQSTLQLAKLVENQATSLALNDVFGFMGYVLVGLLLLVPLSFLSSRATT